MRKKSCKLCAIKSYGKCIHLSDLKVSIEHKNPEDKEIARQLNCMLAYVQDHPEFLEKMGGSMIYSDILDHTTHANLNSMGI